MKIHTKITHHARQRVYEYIGYMEDDEIVSLSRQPDSEYRFVWNSTLTSRHCVRTLITIIPNKRETNTPGDVPRTAGQ